MSHKKACVEPLLPVMNRVFRREGGKCFWCNRKVCIGGKGKTQATKDHVLPKAKGGRGGVENIVLACAPCNNKKQDALVNPATNERINPEVLAVFLKEG
jgi:5-methylcytosine-specific restriction endonuclease McrA